MQVVWFKRDLRVVDHRPLVEAVTLGPVLPLIVVEPDFWSQPDRSARQFHFFRSCALALSADLAALGQRLVVRVGTVTSTLTEIQRAYGLTDLWSHQETGNDWTYRRDLEVAAWCRQTGVRWTEFPQDGVTRKLKTRDGWAQTWHAQMAQDITPTPVAIAPTAPGLDYGTVPTANNLGLRRDNPSLCQKGGRSQALLTMQSFHQERGELYRSAMSSPLEGESACSRLSPYLAFGAISLREVAQATQRQQAELKRLEGDKPKNWRASMASFTKRLHWRSHFMQKLESEPRLEFQNLHPAYDGLRTSATSDAALLEAWQKGETGLPFVDACMRYLTATGWLNFRMRAMLMSVASYHLWLHWREPGLHLARLFTDYEPGIHWPQTQMQSGTTGINTVRIYNPIKQGYDQDPKGEFVRRWVPELASLNEAEIHEPWKSQQASKLLDKAYPMPVVDYLQAARDARQRIYATRKGEGFRDAAAKILSKHGSRKGRFPRKREKTRTSNDAITPHSEQLALELTRPRGQEPD